MAPDDVERFGRWADSYERHWMQSRIFGPVQAVALDLAAAEVSSIRAILDVGCGTGRLLRAAAQRFPRARLEGVDAAPEMVRTAARLAPPGRVGLRIARAESLPFADGSFDAVFSTLTFHHWADQPAAAAEIARVLAPGGRWLLADFVASGFMRPARRLLRLRRFPSRRTLDALLQPSGLAVLAERRPPGLFGQVPVLAIGVIR